MKDAQFFLLLIFSVMIGCVPANQHRFDDQQDFVRPSTTEVNWDQLYEQSKVQWKRKVKQSVLSVHSQLPDKHLVLAIKSFNTVKERDVCLEAAYKFLYRQAQLNGQLIGENRELFSKLVEYTLRNPESFDINRLHYLCGEFQNDICNQLK